MKELLTFHVSPSLKAKLRREAEFQKRSMNQQMTLILEERYELRQVIAENNPDLPDADTYK